MADRPNVLFIITDHTSAGAVAPDGPCRIPALDALAAQGTRFGRFYTTNAICSPARASLMTGLFPSTHGMWDCTHTQRPEWVDVPASRFTYFSQLLAGAGYQTAYFGKWHVEQSGRLEDFGWREYDLDCNKASVSPIPGTEVIVPKEGYRDYLLAAIGEEIQSHPAFDRGIEFLQRQAGSDHPFFCVVSASEPHDPYVPPRSFFDQYDLDSLPLSPTLRDPLEGKPEIVRRMRSVWDCLTEEQWRRTTAAYRAVVSFLDREVGRIVEVLRETGQWEDTIVVFTADHGDMLGGHGLVAKGVGTPYEEVYNVPFIIRVPGSKGRGEDRDSLISMVDVAPTLLDLCGAGSLPVAHGRSFRPVLEGTADPEEWRDAYAEFFGQRFVYTQRIVWHDRWKYVFSPGGMDELYDLARDPHEQVNLAYDPAHREVLVDMCRRMWRKMKEIGDESLFNTQYATLRTAPVGPGVIE